MDTFLNMYDLPELGQKGTHRLDSSTTISECEPEIIS